MESSAPLYTVSTALTGTTIAAANVSPVAADAAVALAVWNPPASGKILEVVRTRLLFVSGTPGAGAWAYNLGRCPGITATANATPVPIPPSARPSQARGFVQTALTGSSALTLLHPFATIFAGAIGATSVGLATVDEVDGEIVVRPGELLAVAAPATGTTCIVVINLTYRERDA